MLVTTTTERDTMTSNLHLIPSAVVEQTPEGIIVYVEYPYAGVDRPRTMGWQVGEKPRLAARLAAAIRAGRAMAPGTVRTDINGRTYVEAASYVLGRTLNADLRRLGF